MNEPIKTCSCGRSYDADTWQALPLAGHQNLDPPDEPDSGERIELRTCPCKSTIAVLVYVPCGYCGGHENNIEGCVGCCRDCGRPCSFEKDAEGFHA